MIAVATPTSNPRERRLGSRVQSKKHIAIKTMPTRPKPISSCTGENVSATTQTTANAIRGLANRCTRRSVETCATQTSAMIDTRFQIAKPRCSEIAANGAANTAASGG